MLLAVLVFFSPVKLGAVVQFRHQQLPVSDFPDKIVFCYVLFRDSSYFTNMFATEYPEFTTVTCLEWKAILESDREKEIIIDSMRFLVKEARATIFAFVLMSNHFHLIWQMMANHKKEDEQRNFLRFTGQQILKNFRNDNSAMLIELLVQAKDRKYQVWERNSLNIPLWSQKIIDQKLEYIHMNPVKKNLCQYPEEYKYSSARFYIMNEKNWDFLTHIDE